MFDKKIEKLREELRKEMLELADSREAKLRNDISNLMSKVDVLNFKLRANGQKYILVASQIHNLFGPYIYIEHVHRGEVKACSHRVSAKGCVSAKVVGDYIEIYDDKVLIEVLMQHCEYFINVDIDMYKNSKKYDEIYNQPVHAVKENDDVQQKKN